MFYEFSQNNSGGSFVVNDKLCHRLFIEANSLEEANKKAEELGCYWNGVNAGIDCSCCGDRWDYGDEINLDSLTEFSVSDYNSEQSWYKRYGSYHIVKPPKLTTGYLVNSWCGVISISSIEEYAQYLATEYGWTSPDSRIYYQDGTVKEVFRETKQDKENN